MIHVFLVAIDTENYVEPKVVENYLGAALKRFDEYNKKENKFSYFDGMRRPFYRILKIPVQLDDKKRMLVDETIREVVMRIKNISVLFGKLKAEAIERPPP